MPPIDSTPQATIRYLTQIIAVLARKAGGSLHIKQSALRKIKEESFRLVEDLDDRKDEIVLRFDPKHVWMLAIESECQPFAQKSVPLPAVQPVTRVNGSMVMPIPPKPNGEAPTGSFPPYTEAQLARAERRIAAIRTASAIKRERSPTG